MINESNSSTPCSLIFLISSYIYGSNICLSVYQTQSIFLFSKLMIILSLSFE